jgi:pleiotropic regulator 1
VFTAGADGSLRSWALDSKSGQLSDSAVREKAHEGRVTGLVWHKGMVYSVSYDGNLKVRGSARRTPWLAGRALCSLPRPAAASPHTHPCARPHPLTRPQAWDAESLNLVLTAKAAHGGERIHCIAAGPDGQLYTGGWVGVLAQVVSPGVVA